MTPIASWRTSLLPLLHNCRRNQIPTPQQEIELGGYELITILSQFKLRHFQCFQSKSQSSPHYCAFNFSLAILVELPIQKCTLLKCRGKTPVFANVSQRPNRIVNLCKLMVGMSKFPSGRHRFSLTEGVKAEVRKPFFVFALPCQPLLTLIPQ